MAEHADRVCREQLFEELEQSAGRAGVSPAEVKELTGLVCTVADKVGTDLSIVSRTFGQYTRHDMTHCVNVINLMGRFIPKDTLSQLNALELTFLLLSGLLHDVGMVVDDAEKQKALTSDEFLRFCTDRPDRQSAAEAERKQGNALRAQAIEDALLAEFFRVIHPERVGDYVKAEFGNQSVFRETSFETDLVSVCQSHGWGVGESRDSANPTNAVRSLKINKRFGGLGVNMQYLASCLRLADVMDFDRSRSPLSVFRRIDFTETKSVDEWMKHLQITGWEITPDVVRYEAACTHPAYYVAVNEFLDYVDTELRECRYLLDDQLKSTPEHYEFRLPPAVDRRHVEMEDSKYLAGAFRFHLEYNEIMKLLMDKSLYPDPSLFLRELLQNSLDACRHRMALLKKSGKPHAYNPRITVWDYSDDPKEPRVVFQDNGMGMSQRTVENYFMRVGKSYYRSPEFLGEKKRLLDKGITLDACSRFGIGILSCFLVADKFRVETYRLGSEPLDITVEGPDKYFVIERMLRPKSEDPASTGVSQEEEHPPYCPGTRITVYLKPGVQVNPHELLQTFAVNVEFPISMRGPGDTDSLEISPLRWERAITFGDFPEVLGEVYPIPGDQSPDMSRETASSLEKIIIPSRIPFEKWEFSRNFRGLGWIWMLCGRDGKPSPCRGYLEIGPDVHVIGVPVLCHDLSKFIHDNHVAANVFFEELHEVMGMDKEYGMSMVDRGIEMLDRLDLHEGCVEGNIIDLMERWAGLDCAQRDFILKTVHPCHRYDGVQVWWSLSQVAEGLLQGSLDSAHCHTCWAEALLSHFNSLSVFLPDPRVPQEMALHGILIPAGIVKWDPMKGQAVPADFIPIPGGLRVDVRGESSPSPVASRLFVDYDGAVPTIATYLRALLHHAADLTYGRAKDPSWRKWYCNVLCRTLTLGVPIPTEDIEYLASSMSYMYRGRRGGWRFLTHSELLSKFGQRVIHGARAGFAERDIMNAILLRRHRKRELGDGSIEIDVESVSNPECATIQEAVGIGLGDEARYHSWWMGI